MSTYPSVVHIQQGLKKCKILFVLRRDFFAVRNFKKVGLNKCKMPQFLPYDFAACMQ